MTKSFNVNGACKANRHYMVDLKSRLTAIKRMVDANEYFTINKARQFGKTTTLRALADFLKKDYFKLDFDEIPVRFPGTGDIFSSVLMGGILEGNDLKSATQRAMDTVRNMIVENQNNKDKYKGIPLELCMEALDR